MKTMAIVRIFLAWCVIKLRVRHAFSDIVGIFDLAHENWHAPAGIDLVNRSLVGSALVNCNLFGIAIRT